MHFVPALILVLFFHSGIAMADVFGNDDVEFVANRAQNRIDVRSASRLGHGDFGVNRKRIEAARAALAAEAG